MKKEITVIKNSQDSNLYNIFFEKKKELTHVSFIVVWSSFSNMDYVWISIVNWCTVLCRVRNNYHQIRGRLCLYP